jgi:hypothetical protein
MMRIHMCVMMTTVPTVRIAVKNPILCRIVSC